MYSCCIQSLSLSPILIVLNKVFLTILTNEEMFIQQGELLQGESVCPTEAEDQGQLQPEREGATEHLRAGQPSLPTHPSSLFSVWYVSLQDSDTTLGSQAQCLFQKAFLTNHSKGENQNQV